jgi:uncharacterized membrane protein
MATDQPESGGRGFQFNEIGLIYGVVFGVLVVACASVVIVILVLKYIQITRREDDKGETVNLYTQINSALPPLPFLLAYNLIQISEGLLKL